MCYTEESLLELLKQDDDNLGYYKAELLELRRLRRERILKEALAESEKLKAEGRAGEAIKGLPRDMDIPWGTLQTLWPVVVAVDAALRELEEDPDDLF